MITDPTNPGDQYQLDTTLTTLLAQHASEIECCPQCVDRRGRTSPGGMTPIGWLCFHLAGHDRSGWQPPRPWAVIRTPG